MKRGSVLLIIFLSNSHCAMRRNPGYFAHDDDIKAAIAIKACEEVSLNELVLTKDSNGKWCYAQVTHPPSLKANWHGMVSFDPQTRFYKNFVVNFKKVKKLPEEKADEFEESFIKFLEKITF